jgi:hypothetical protein
LLLYNYSLEYVSGPPAGKIQIKGKNFTPTILKCKSSYTPKKFDAIFIFLRNKEEKRKILLDVTSPKLFKGLIELKRLKVNPSILKGKTKNDSHPTFYLEYNLRRDSNTLQILTSPLFHLDAHGKIGETPLKKEKVEESPRKKSKMIGQRNAISHFNSRWGNY